MACIISCMAIPRWLQPLPKEIVCEPVTQYFIPTDEKHLQGNRKESKKTNQTQTLYPDPLQLNVFRLQHNVAWEGPGHEIRNKHLKMQDFLSTRNTSFFTDETPRLFLFLTLFLQGYFKGDTNLSLTTTHFLTLIVSQKLPISPHFLVVSISRMCVA